MEGWRIEDGRMEDRGWKVEDETKEIFYFLFSIFYLLFWIGPRARDLQLRTS
jgi:hypothetical protein